MCVCKCVCSSMLKTNRASSTKKFPIQKSKTGTGRQRHHRRLTPSRPRRRSLHNFLISSQTCSTASKLSPSHLEFRKKSPKTRSLSSLNPVPFPSPQLHTSPPQPPHPRSHPLATCHPPRHLTLQIQTLLSLLLKNIRSLRRKAVPRERLMTKMQGLCTKLMQSILLRNRSVRLQVARQILCRKIQ